MMLKRILFKLDHVAYANVEMYGQECSSVDGRGFSLRFRYTTRFGRVIGGLHVYGKHLGLGGRRIN